MTTLLFDHAASRARWTPSGHPERAGRIVAVAEALATSAFAGLVRAESPRAAREAVLAVHPEPYLQALEAGIPEAGIAAIDDDTFLSAAAYEAAFRAAGGAVAAVDAVMARRANRAFCLHRPPGHHAEPTQAMGFCLFNHAAIAARHAQLRHGAGRVAIVDFDVHHGNGSQAAFWDDPTVLYASTHQFPLYPGSGAASETGVHGTIVNAPLRPGAGSVQFREAIETRILPALDVFTPDFLIISAGFDAHADDPLALLRLDEADFAWVTARLCDFADRACGGRVVSVLEGGYDLASLARSAAAHVGTLMGLADPLAALGDWEQEPPPRAAGERRGW